MDNHLEKIKYMVRDKIRGGIYPEFLVAEEIKKVRDFHLSMDEYEATPLAKLETLAKYLGLGGIYVKDESYRFGLNAFKGLGGTYAIAKLLCKKLHIDINDASFEYFNRPEVKEKIKDMIFVTATDGNHGRGVAWAATKLGCKSVVYMPKGSSQIRLEAIKEAGAEASITDLNYDDAVRLAQKMSEEHGWYMVQDTAWDGYEEIPNWITQGYTTMANESLEQLKLEGIKRPTHMFLQAGVGSFAGAMLGYYANVFKEDVPTTIIVEPNLADCIYKSALAEDGKPRFVGGDMNTIMAGLACGEPNTITWEILRDFASAYVSCPDYVAARGMRVMASPMMMDDKVVSGESGAVGLGLLTMIMERKELKDLRDKLGLNKDSIVLCFSTEGDTDPEHYKKVVYDGKNPSC
ncbi:diaminopropionate ammonia-lyase [Anaeromicrobium sediminis]|uniref:Diaminopropionate ammonia-lyase n=1 Tax=Anaeromicrobium sediminis TaxID=1478221 RepID=A0A267MJQ6_9FIRM|nr:diaminopropionate ammonia-lyase [Anaeromicrobium sediminis]PAB59652.1 diaminopropionate ammonia-lyase [Anaeromicrobium sediminis]